MKKTHQLYKIWIIRESLFQRSLTVGVKKLWREMRSKKETHLTITYHLNFNLLLLEAIYLLNPIQKWQLQVTAFMEVVWEMDRMLATVRYSSKVRSTQLTTKLKEDTRTTRRLNLLLDVWYVPKICLVTRTIDIRVFSRLILSFIYFIKLWFNCSILTCLWYMYFREVGICSRDVFHFFSSASAFPWVRSFYLQTICKIQPLFSSSRFYPTSDRFLANHVCWWYDTIL